MKEPNFDNAGQVYSEGIANKYQEQEITQGQLKLYAKKDFEAGARWGYGKANSQLGTLREQFEKRTIKPSMEVASVGHQWAAQAKREAFKEAIEMLDKLFCPTPANDSKKS